MIGDATLIHFLELYDRYFNTKNPRLFVRVHGSLDRKDSKEYLADLARCADEGMMGHSAMEDHYHIVNQYAGILFENVQLDRDFYERIPIAYLTNISGDPTRAERTTDYSFNLFRINSFDPTELSGTGTILTPSGVGTQQEHLLQLTLSKH